MVQEWHNFILPRLSLECVRHGIIDPRGLTTKELAGLMKNDLPIVIAIQEVTDELKRRNNTAEIIPFPRNS